MPLDESLLKYPMRRYGMDHDRYEWSMLAGRKGVSWPGGKLLALWVNTSLQFYPLNPARKPLAVPGNMTTVYPDLRHFSLREYGNRVGIFRMLKAFDRYGVDATFAVNAELAERNPGLISEIRARESEIIAYSWSMDSAHAAGIDERTEADVVRRSIDKLRKFGAPVRGWLSPGRFESERTPDLIRAEGIDYFCDWVNDDMPYRFHTAAGDLWAMPLSAELEDRTALVDNFHSEASWAEQVIDAADMLIDEARSQGGRILSLSLHPWLVGQPHRIKYVESILEDLMSRPEVFSASASEILDIYVAQAGDARAAT